MPKRKIFNLIKVSLLLVLIIYFSFHILNGTRGVIKYIDLQSELHKKEKLLTQVKFIEARLEKKIKGLSEKNIDLDLLEEEARRALGYIKDEEEVLFH